MSARSKLPSTGLVGRALASFKEKLAENGTVPRPAISLLPGTDKAPVQTAIDARLAPRIDTGARPEELVKLPTASGPSRRGSHYYASAMSCAREFAFSSILKLRSIKDSDALILGTLVHDIIAYYYAARMPEDQRPAWYQRPVQEAVEEDCHGRTDLVEKAIEMCRVYIEKVGQYETGAVIAVEQEFTVTIGEIDPEHPDPKTDNEILTWKPDIMLLVWQTDDIDKGLIYIDDHKTVGFVDYKTGKLRLWKPDNEFNYSWQSLVYRIGTDVIAKKHAWPYAIGGFIIERLGKTDPYDADSHPLRRVPRLVYDEARATLREAARRSRRIADGITAGVAPEPDFTKCWRGRPCDYAEICWSESLTDRERIVSQSFKQAS